MRRAQRELSGYPLFRFLHDLENDLVRIAGFYIRPALVFLDDHPLANGELF